jgi:hypothetical protein
MTPQEIFAELDRLEITIFYQRLGRNEAPGTRLRFGDGSERVYPELRSAIEKQAPEILKLARFEPSRSAPVIYYRKPGRSGAT